MKLSHVTILTSKIEDEINFYTKYLGLKVIEDLREVGSNIVFLAEDDQASRIELIENEKIEKISCKGITIGFACSDLPTKRKQLEEAGFKPGKLIAPNDRVEFFFVEDPAGANIQFINTIVK